MKKTRNVKINGKNYSVAALRHHSSPVVCTTSNTTVNGIIVVHAYTITDLTIITILFIFNESQ
jgi:hypothetical protein